MLPHCTGHVIFSSITASGDGWVSDGTSVHHLISTASIHRECKITAWTVHFKRSLKWSRWQGVLFDCDWMRWMQLFLVNTVPVDNQAPDGYRTWADSTDNKATAFSVATTGCFAASTVPVDGSIKAFALRHISSYRETFYNATGNETIRMAIIWHLKSATYFAVILISL